jgi:hypothetical protein
METLVTTPLRFPISSAWVIAILTAIYVLLTGVYVVVAIKTLRAIEEQATIARNGLILLNRAYLTTDGWNLEHDGHGNLTIQFAVYNPSRTAARIERMDYKIGHTTTTQTSGTMLTPEERWWFTVGPEPFKTGDVLLVTGRITYTDIFRKERHRKFAKYCVIKPQGATFTNPEGVGLNDEEEWDTQDG